MGARTCAGILGLLLCGASAADDLSNAMAAFRRAAGHDARAEALKDFPKDDPAAVKALLDLAPKTDSWIRGKIVEFLAEENFCAALAEVASKGTAWQSREAAVAALGELDEAPSVLPALADKEWRVRRSAVLALGGDPSREKVDALIGRLPAEKERRVLVHLIATLQGWTGQRWGADSAKWGEWWSAHSAEKLDPAAAEKGKIEFQGLTLRHETIALYPTDLGMVVLPDYPMRPEYYRPHLDSLATKARLHYVRLPDPKSLKLDKDSNGTPIYPVDSLAGALETMRKQFQEKKVVLLAHGMSGWLAMAYAQRYPEAVSALILVSAWPDEDSFLDSARRAKKQAKADRDGDLESLASYNLGETHEWAMSRTVARLRLLTADADDPILYRILPTFWEDYGEFVVIPDVGQRFRQGIPTPALFIYGARDSYSGESEFARAKKNFPSATSISLRQSGQLPFLDEPDKFEEAVVGFLKRAGVVK